MLLQASRLVAGKSPLHARPSLAYLSTLPPNLKLADAKLLTEPRPRSHQVVTSDPPRSVRDRNAAFVFQRPGLLGKAIQVPVLPFASLQGGGPEEAADPSTPPPPPELVTLNPRVFGLPLRLDILQTVVKWQLACRRQGTGSTKRIGDVRGSGAKLRPQKGGGRARVGHSRPPQFRGGAKAHGPPTGGRDWSYTINKKERRLGLATALSQKLAEGNLVVVDGIGQHSHRTKDLGTKLSRLVEEEGEESGGEGGKAATAATMARTMVVVEDGVLSRDQHPHPSAAFLPPVSHDLAPEEVKTANDNFLKAAANLKKTHVIRQLGCNVYDLLKCEKVVLTLRAVKLLEARLTTPVRRKRWDDLASAFEKQEQQLKQA